MPVCQHWQRGQCRYGNNCRFEHAGPGGFAPAVAAQQPQQQQQQQHQHTGDITNTLVQTVKVDIEQWEKGRQWVFSCYSPAKETACYPGLEDISPEEMRLEAYAARASNAMDQYVKKVADLSADYAGKRRALLAPTEQIKDALRRIYNRESLVGVPPLTALPAPGSIFGGGAAAGPAAGAAGAAPAGGVFQSKPSVFGGGGGGSSIVSAPSSSASSLSSASSSGLFGKPATSAFGGGTSVFGGAHASSSSGTSLFGGATQQRTSTFGGGERDENPTFYNTNKKKCVN